MARYFLAFHQVWLIGSWNLRIYLGGQRHCWYSALFKNRKHWSRPGFKTWVVSEVQLANSKATESLTRLLVVVVVFKFEASNFISSLFVTAVMKMMMMTIMMMRMMSTTVIVTKMMMMMTMVMRMRICWELYYCLLFWMARCDFVLISEQLSFLTNWLWETEEPVLIFFKKQTTCIILALSEWNTHHVVTKRRPNHLPCHFLLHVGTNQ